MTDILLMSVDEFYANPNASTLLAEYAAESTREWLPTPCATPNREAYERIESAGILTVFGAFDDRKGLIGFLTVIAAFNPHYGVMLAHTEAFFVASAHRSSGVGLKLLKQAQEAATAKGAVGFFVTTLVGSRLSTVLPRAGYTSAVTMFYKSLA